MDKQVYKDGALVRLTLTNFMYAFFHNFTFAIFFILLNFIILFFIQYNVLYKLWEYFQNEGQFNL